MAREAAEHRLISLDYDSSPRPPRPNLDAAAYRYFLGMLLATGLTALVKGPADDIRAAFCCISFYAIFGFGFFRLAFVVRKIAVRHPPLQERNSWLSVLGGAITVAIWLLLFDDSLDRYANGTWFYLFGYAGTPAMAVWLVFKRAPV